MTRTGVYTPMSEHARLWAARGTSARGAAMATIEVLERRPTSGMSEADLFAAGLGRNSDTGIRARSEACVCGGVIRVEDRDDDWLIARTVRVHNESTAHRQGLDDAGWGS